jgi:hypothetical protein
MALNINGTTGISGVDGSASAPALQGTDSNTGINFGSDTVNINTGGVTRATVDSSGSLDVPSTFPIKVSGSEKLRIASDGKIGIGETSPATAMHIKNADDPVTITLQNSDSNTPTNSGGEIIFKGTKDNGDPIFFGGVGGRRRNQSSDVTGYLGLFRQAGDGSNNAIEGMRIDHNGHIGLSPNGIDPDSTGGITVRQSSNTDHGPVMSFNTIQSGQGFTEFRSSGTQVGSIGKSGTTGTVYSTSSDYRLKENAVTISDGISRLKTLKPYRFNFIAEPDRTVDGFFAHEVTAVPEAITGTKDEVDTDDNPVYQAIDQSKLVPLLTAALQEAVAKIEVLETKVAALEAG